MISITVILGLLGLVVGSFVNALVWRLHERKDWIGGRSQCVNCGHALAANDLIPVVSWLALGGRCRYCHRPISVQYPIVELTMALVFALSYVYWPGDLGSGGQLLLFISWLIESVGLLALAVYDWRWMILPNQLIYATLLLAASSRLIFIVAYESDVRQALLSWLASIAVAGGLFWLIFQLSRGRYIGFGDVRLGLVIGTILATPTKSFLMIFLASILGSLFALPGLASKDHNLNSRIPFGPFLIAASFLVVLFGQSLIDWYTQLTF